MAPETKCQNCGGTIDSSERSCPYCGTAQKAQVGAPTMLSVPARQPSPFNSAAEAMDEIKSQLRQGNKINAVKVYREHFNTGLKEAKDAVDAIESDLKFQSAPQVDDGVADYAHPEVLPAESTISANPFDEPQKPSSARRWIIGGSIAAVVFLCLCCCLPLLIALFSLTNQN